MPVSLNINENDVQSQPSASGIRHKVKTTREMVDDALIQLHSAKGVTLREIYKYILSSYALDTVSNARVTLIKKHLNELRENEEIINKTGRGFLGHLKLVNKEKFVRRLQANQRQRATRHTTNMVDKKSNPTGKKKSIARETSKTTKAKTNKKKSNKRNINKALLDVQQPLPVVPRQTSPVRESHALYDSIFDTPMVLSSHQRSTPHPESNVVPQAPDLRGKENRKRVLYPHAEDVGDTPRSSLPSKKRRIEKRDK